MVTSKEAQDYLKRKIMESGNYEGVAQRWTKMDALYASRRWHELTVELLDLVKQPQLNQGRLLIELYENFIQEFEQRIKTISFVELCAAIVKQYGQAEDALKFMDKCEKRITTTTGNFKTDPFALAYCKIISGQIMLREMKDNPRPLKALLEEIDGILDKTEGITKVDGLFYQLESQFLRETGDLTGYYRSALKYLGCVNAKTLSLAEQQEHAKMLAISALVADGIYNFGELLSHPVLDSIKATSDKWLVDMLVALNHGNIADFEKLRTKWSANRLLAQKETVLRNKAILLAIMEMTFRRSSFERQLSFDDIAQTTNLRPDQVEMFVMKAISKGLVAGKIDESEKKVYMTWVLPRVLDSTQVGNMISRLDKWQKDIVRASTMVEDDAIEAYD